MGFWDTIFGNSSPQKRGGWSSSSSSDYDSNGYYNPGAWREKYECYDDNHF